MRSSAASTRPTTPFSLWLQLAWSTNEMVWASAEVIARRTQGILLQGINPTAAGRRELVLMGGEKLTAFAQSMVGSTVSLARLNVELGTVMLKQSLAGAAATLALLNSRSAGELARTHSALLRGGTQRSA